MCKQEDDDDLDDYGSQEQQAVITQPFSRYLSQGKGAEDEDEDKDIAGNSFEMVHGDSEDCQAARSLHWDTHSHHHPTETGTIITLESGAIPIRVNVRGTAAGHWVSGKLWYLQHIYVLEIP